MNDLIKNIDNFISICGKTNTFDIAFEWAMYNETGGEFLKDNSKDGISNDKDDTGGFTRFGIAQNTNSVNVNNLTLKDAENFYKEKYFYKMKLDKMDKYLAIFLFDFACGSGVGTTVMQLQEELNVIPDGIVGNKTLNAILCYIDENGLIELLNRLTLKRISRYNRKIKVIPSNGKFLKGWACRTYFIDFKDRNLLWENNKEYISSIDEPTKLYEEYYK